MRPEALFIYHFVYLIQYTISFDGSNCRYMNTDI